MGERWVPGRLRYAQLPGMTAEFGARSHIRLSNGKAREAPVLCWARGFARSPSLFPSPERGGWRAERRMFRITPERPEDHSVGRPGSAGSDASKPDASASFDAPSRYPGNWPFTGPGPTGVVVRSDPVPQEPPGDVDVSATPAGTASRPTLMTPHDGAPRWTGRRRA